MNKIRFAWFVSCAFLEFIRYEVLLRMSGSGRILQQLNCGDVTPTPFPHALEREICDAVLLATCFYWKPVLCLQRSVCTARLLKKRGVHAQVVIGYRPSPFFSHAWVEIDGRVIYGSPAYKQQLRPLFVA